MPLFATRAEVEYSSGYMAENESMSGIDWASEPDIDALSRFHALLQNDPQAALIGLEALANRGSAMGMWYLADAYMGRATTPRSVCKARYWSERAEMAGIHQPLHMLGRMFFEQKEYVEALATFSASARGGYAPSIYRVAKMYREGLGTQIDIEKCRALLIEAASKRHVFAKRNLMGLYLTGAFGCRSFLRGILMIPSLLGDIIALKSLDGPKLEERIIC